MIHWKYLKYILIHKWFVFYAGVKLGVPVWQLLVHDMSKFLPSEWFPYAEFFYARSKKDIRICKGKYPWPQKPMPKDDLLGQESSWKDEQKLRFDQAWNLHQKRNKHHWQFWLLTEDDQFWAIWSHNNMGDYQIAHNNKAFDFWIDIPLERDDWYRELTRLVDTLNARPVALPMPEKYIREMVADWCGAGRAITGKWDISEWYEKNKDKMILHADTRTRVEELIKTAEQNLE